MNTANRENFYLDYSIQDCFFYEDYGNATGDWLEEAIRLDQYLISKAPHMKDVRNRIYEEIRPYLTLRVAEKRLKQTLTTIVMNLFVSTLTGVPIRISKDRNTFTWHNRYGKLYMKYGPFIAILNGLSKEGYVVESGHIRNDERNYGRQTRIWGSDKFISLMNRTPVHRANEVDREKQTQLIQLKDEDKRLINFKWTPRIKQMSNNLRRYNDFIDKQIISVKSDNTPEISFESIRDKVLIKSLKGTYYIRNIKVREESSYTITQSCRDFNNYYNSLDPHFLVSDFKSTACLEEAVSYRKAFDIYAKDKRVFVVTNCGERAYNIEKVPYHLYDEKYQYESTVYSDSEYKYQALLGLIVRGSHRAYGYSKEESKKTRPLGEFGITGLEFEIKHNRLHRVFNLNSFKLGGRFFGGGYQTMPRDLRPFIHINNEPTVELDYSAHHVRLLYHMAHIDYREDPYLALTSDEDERDVLKKLVLIALNAKDENRAIWEFIDVAKEEFCKKLSHSYVKGLMQDFKDIHSRIADNMHCVGRMLQNKDAEITEKILVKLLDLEIPCLPVHDSYIVPAQHKNTLKGVMRDEYKKIAGNFEPVIG